MIIFKCKCGSTFSITDLDYDRGVIRCPNCQKSFRYYAHMELSEFEHELTTAEMTAQVVPGNASFTVSFDL